MTAPNNPDPIDTDGLHDWEGAWGAIAIALLIAAGIWALLILLVRG